MKRNYIREKIPNNWPILRLTHLCHLCSGNPTSIIAIQQQQHLTNTIIRHHSNEQLVESAPDHIDIISFVFFTFFSLFLALSLFLFRHRHLRTDTLRLTSLRLIMQFVLGQCASIISMAPLCVISKCFSVSIRRRITHISLFDNFKYP